MSRKKLITRAQFPKDFFSTKLKPISKETQRSLEIATEKANESIRRNNLIYSSNANQEEYPVTSNSVGFPTLMAKKDTKEEKTIASSNIYVYMGTYEINDNKSVNNPNDFPTSFDSSTADYRLYIKIGIINREIPIAISEQIDFERENIVLYPPKEIDKIAYFNEVREMYFNTLIEYGQAKAIGKVLNFQSSSLTQTFSLEDLIEHVNSEDEEDFELEIPSNGQRLALSEIK